MNCNSIAVIGLVLLLAGCSGGASDQPELGQVTGTVTVDGTGTGGLRVVFQPESGRRSIGITDENGNYSLDYTKGTKGAKIGLHQVSIIWTGESDLESADGAESVDAVAAGADAPQTTQQITITAKYNTESTLTFDVTANANVANFDVVTTESN